MRMKDYVSGCSRERLHRQVADALGYREPDWPDMTAVDALREQILQTDVIATRVLLAFPYMKLRDRVLYEAAAVYELADVLNCPRVEKLDELILEASPGLEGEDRMLLWDLGQQELEELVDLTAQLPEPVPVRRLTAAQLAGVILVKDPVAHAAPPLLAAYLVAQGQMAENADGYDATRKLADRQYQESGYAPDLPVHGLLQALYNSWERYSLVTRWRRELAGAYLLEHARKGLLENKD